jgi:hypothetical protein
MTTSISPGDKRSSRDRLPEISVDSFFEFVQDCVSADAQDACGIADAAAIESHVDNLRFDHGYTPFVGRMKQERLVGTVGIVPAITLLVCLGFPALGDVVTWTIRTRHSNQDHGISLQMRESACHMYG